MEIVRVKSIQNKIIISQKAFVIHILGYTSGSQTVRRGALGRREIFKYFH
jgi:hypothetical protein